jgi:hypothetical protein
VWIVESDAHIDSTDINEHVAFIFRFLQTHEKAIVYLKSATSMRTQIRVFCDFDGTLSFNFGREELRIFANTLDDVIFAIT